MERASVPAWVHLSAWAVRHMPFGRYRTSAWLGTLPRRPFVARSARRIGGFRFWCDPRDAIAREVCFTGEYEPPQTLVLSALLQPGMTVVDVGANWGYFTLLSASRVLPEGRVLAFEPEPRLFRELERNVALNRFTRIDLFPLAASSASGALALEEYDERIENRGLSRVIAAGAIAQAPTIAVRCESVDHVLARTPGIDAVDVIKIDVEGYEHEVLAGMRTGLLERRYRHVLIELHPTLLPGHGASVDDCCAVLAAAGYEGWTLDNSPAAVRRAAYARRRSPSEFMSRASRPPASDPWPHMIWSAPGVPPVFSGRMTAR